jgi:hypothetical protein
MDLGSRPPFGAAFSFFNPDSPCVLEVSPMKDQQGLHPRSIRTPSACAQCAGKAEQSETPGIKSIVSTVVKRDLGTVQ